MARSSQAQRRASQKWQENNRDRTYYVNMRGATRNFIAGTGSIKDVIGVDVSEKVYVDQLEDLLDMINKKIEELE